MKNFIQCGDTLTVPAPVGGVVSGGLYLVGALLGVSVYDAPEGADAELKTTGVFGLPKTAAEAWVVGDPIYLVEGTPNTVAKAGTKLIGYAAAAAANPSPTGAVRLNGTAVTAAAVGP